MKEKKKDEVTVKIRDTISLKQFAKRAAEAVPLAKISAWKWKKVKKRLMQALEHQKAVDEIRKDGFETRIIDFMRKKDSEVWKRLRMQKMREFRQLFKQKKLRRVIESMGFVRVHFESELVMGGFEMGRGLTYQGFRVKVFLEKEDGTMVRLRLKDDEKKRRPVVKKPDEHQKEAEGKGRDVNARK